ncbi:hypothetical protein SY88_03005 [Clostridiales bacterium PH28_bin88]|nr:hypothetical protein SY88_03005 [Clostridiales bacterium PH28_bin88]
MIKEITDHLYLLVGENQGRFPYSNSLYIQDRHAGLIDTGAGKNRLEKIQKKSIELLINSHYHIDHVHNNRMFPHALVHAHRLDAPVMRSREKFRYSSGLCRVPAAPETIFNTSYPCSQVDVELQDGDLINFGATRLRVIHTPGHTPGHSAFYEETSGVLFAADVDVTPFGPWYGNETSDIDQFIDSIHKLIAMNPRVIITSHEPPVTENIQERLMDYLQVIFNRERLILDFLVRPRSLDDIVAENFIYRKFPEPVALYQLFERIMIEKHLRRLEKMGLVVDCGDLYHVA